MTTKLSLFNDALLLCGERFLASTTENVEARRLLDQVYDNGGVKSCLEEGQWFFAMRSIQIDYDTSIDPDFGYERAFEKPDDWCLTSALCTDEFFRAPCTRYVDEAGYWYSDVDTLYVRYVSNGVLYGLDLNKWPEAFKDFVAAHFAWRIIYKIQSSEEERDQVKKARRECLLRAKSLSLMAGPVLFPAQGSWSRARNRFPGRRDGGNSSGSLIG